MSIYFQFPAIDDYPNLNYSTKNDVENEQNLKDEDILSVDQIIELKNYLTFKQL